MTGNGLSAGRDRLPMGRSNAACRAEVAAGPGRHINTDSAKSIRGLHIQRQNGKTDSQGERK